MTMKFIKKMLAVTLAATMMVAPALTVCATTEPSAPAASSGTTEAPNPFKEAVSATTPQRLGGQTLKSDVPGTIVVPAKSNLQGMVLRQSAATIAAAGGLGKGERPNFTAYVLSRAKSKAVYASIDGAAASMGATVLDAFNANLAKIGNGKRTNLSADVAVPMTIGVKNANGRTLALVKVVGGGQTTVLQDQDDNPDTITAPISGGDAAYAVIAY